MKKSETIISVIDPKETESEMRTTYSVMPDGMRLIYKTEKTSGETYYWGMYDPR